MFRQMTMLRRLIRIAVLLTVLVIAHLGVSYWLYDLDDVLANREGKGIPDGLTGPAQVTPLRHGIFLIGASGRNVVAVIGGDGVLLVDSNEPPDLERVQAALDTLTDLPVRYIINTHPHGDHISGNAFFARDGAEVIATRLAAERIREDDAASGRSGPPPSGTVPDIVFDGSYRIRFGPHTVEIIEVPDAHSEGDAVVRFVEANVIAAGDLFINEGLPYIATDKGRSIDGYLAGMGQLIAMTDDESIIAPGHGPVGDRTRLIETRDRLAGVRDAVAFRKGLGLSQKLIILTYPAHDWPVSWQRYGVARKWFVKMIYRSLP
ncbi:MBL fold metallo-hydrolase [Defluviimonas sp. WL0050]|uniref:MBL fold metallo-hydrolase n=2 Tax=Albidovulum litorale TaxID=2984134 RepID=A0ABT2ZM46_9RHOB|nr:MBL fold metallo-hydrolase [Defluviimonas sp. WL0050]